MNAEREHEKCSRCGLCLAVCPTYSMTLREQYSPRGRLVLMRTITKEEDNFPSEKYLGSCLRCALCEEVCPTGVPFGSLMRRFINCTLPLDETSQIEKLRKAAEVEASDPARAVVFNLMIDNRLADEMINRGSEHNLVTEIPKLGTPRLKPTLLIAGAIFSSCYPHIVSIVIGALEETGHLILRSDAADALSLPWLENGLLSVATRLVTRVQKDIDNFEIESIAVLDPTLMDSLAGSLMSTLITIWRRGDAQLLPQSVFQMESSNGLNLETLIQKLPSAMGIDRTLSAASVLHEAVVKSRCASSIITTPAMLRGAGAPPVIDLEATHFLEQLIKSKCTWAMGLSAGLATIDPYTLLRVPEAVHLIETARG